MMKDGRDRCLSPYSDRADEARERVAAMSSEARGLYEEA